MNYQDEILSIDTPENVAFGYNLAGIGSRFLAATVDSLLIVIIQAILLLPIIYILFRQGFFVGLAETWAIGLISLLSFVFLWGYYILFELIWNGQSPGKRLVGIRVIRSDGTPITLSEVLIRNLVRIIDFLPSAYGVGVITMFVDKLSRRLGDMAAGTLVIHDVGTFSIEAIKPYAAPILRAGLSEETILQGFPVGQLSQADLQLIEEYLQRRKSLDLATRHQLSPQVVRKLYNSVGWQDRPLPDMPDTFLDAIINTIHPEQGNRRLE